MIWAFQCHKMLFALKWRHNEYDGVSSHQPHDCLLNRLFRRRSKKTRKLRVTGLCAGKFPAQMASNAENIFIWWRHHGQVVIWTHKGPISYSPCSCVVIFSSWYNCCVSVLYDNEMLFNYKIEVMTDHPSLFENTHPVALYAGFTVLPLSMAQNDMQLPRKPVYNDHLMGYFSAFWSSSSWPWAT